MNNRSWGQRRREREKERKRSEQGGRHNKSGSRFGDYRFRAPICIRRNVSRYQRHPGATFDCHENAMKTRRAVDDDARGSRRGAQPGGQRGGRDEGVVPSFEGDGDSKSRGLPRDTKIGINEIDTTLSYST